MNEATGNESFESQHRTSPGQEFLTRVRHSAMTVLGDSLAGREVLELCDQHGDARRMICEDRSRGVTVIAIVGATGQGKSWLLKQLLRRSAVAGSIRSGNNLDEATEQLTWIGPLSASGLGFSTRKVLPLPDIRDGIDRDAVPARRRSRIDR